MKVILPVAGRGTRLRPHTYSKPKSLVKVAGKTVLDHVMSGLAGLDISEYVIITDENGSIIEKYFKDHFPHYHAVFIPQKELLGPAHAVWMAAPEIEKGDDVLIVFNDTLFVTDLTRIPDLCKDLDGLIFSREVEDYRRFGVSVIRNGIVTDMVEKPEHPVSRFAQVGLYYLRDGSGFMDYIGRAVDLKLTVKGEFYLPEVFKLMIKDGMKFGAPEIDEWLDCGKPDTLLDTNRVLLRKSALNRGTLNDCVVIPPVSTAASAVIHRSIIGPNVSIADNCIISDSIIRESIIDSGSEIRYAILDSSLVGKTVRITGNTHRMNIGDNCSVELKGFDNPESD